MCWGSHTQTTLHSFRFCTSLQRSSLNSLQWLRPRGLCTILCIHSLHIMPCIYTSYKSPDKWWSMQAALKFANRFPHSILAIKTVELGSCLCSSKLSSSRIQCVRRTLKIVFFFSSGSFQNPRLTASPQLRNRVRAQRKMVGIAINTKEKEMSSWSDTRLRQSTFIFARQDSRGRGEQRHLIYFHLIVSL